MNTTPPFPTPEAYIASANRKIGAEVRARREALHVTPYTLAQRCKVSDETILKLERGETCPHLKTLLLLCYHFGVGFEEFVVSAMRRAD